MQMNIQGVFTEASLTGKLHERRQYVATETKSVIAMCDGGTSPGMYVWTAATAVPGSGSSTSICMKSPTGRE